MSCHVRCYKDMGIPIPKTPVIWASPVILTLILTQKEGDAYITRVLGMGMPKTRGCPYHCNTKLQKLYNKGMGTSFRGNDFWDCLVGQSSVVIGRWSRQLLTNHKQRLSTQTSPEIIAPIALTHSPYSFLGGEIPPQNVLFIRLNYCLVGHIPYLRVKINCRPSTVYFTAFTAPV